MLEIRPNCEYCDKDLAADAIDAFICTYECTFCQACVENVLKNVCPNCGGGFSARPIRPSSDYRTGLSLKHQAASDVRVNTNYSATDIATFSAKLVSLKPENR